MFLFVLCSLASWICPLPEYTPSVPPTIAPIISESFYGIGLSWNDTTDEGYCPGYGLPSGNGYPPSLIWPVNSREVNSNRPFSVKHPAIDIYADLGDSVFASAAGTVIWSGWSSFGGGNVIVIGHGGGWYTAYFHLSEIFVICGQWVESGTEVGLVGMTGSSNYSHLHWLLGNGVYAYNPLSYLD